MNEQKYHGLVNRTRSIKSLRDKAEITGYRYILPSQIPTDVIETRHKKTGDILHLSKTEPFEVYDVDGTVHKTVKTVFFEPNGTPMIKRKPEIGVWTDYLAGKYHGKLSRNWKQEYLTLEEILEVLNAGYAFAPGRFDNPPDKSHRSGDYCAERSLILYDGDEWTEEHPAPSGFDELHERYPDISKDFYAATESISSRSSLKPEFRIRLFQVLPTPIFRGQDTLWQTVVQNTVEKYPFIAEGVGIDKVRLSFGNARPDCEQRIWGNLVRLDTFKEWETHAAKIDREQKEVEQRTALKKEQQEQGRREQKRIRSELKKRGVQVSENKYPLEAYREQHSDHAELLRSIGCTHVSGKHWHYPGSSSQQSFTLSDKGNLEIFSSTMQGDSPVVDHVKEKGCGIYRFIWWLEYRLDEKVEHDKKELAQRLAEAGYGTSLEDWKASQRRERAEAAKAGIIVNPPKEQKLKRAEDAPASPEAEPLDEARASLEDKTARVFMNPTQKGTVNLYLVKAGTGVSKTTTLLKVASKLKLRTLMRTPTIDLASQATHVAHEQGFMNPIHLLGREHNWEQSGIAEIPVDERTKDLFNLVNCIYVDICQTYGKHRIAPRTFCEISCPHREGCPHLAQYENLEDRDFIATASPNVLFDLSLRGYLKSLVEAKREPTDTDLAMDAMLGTTSEATDPITLAVIDDYDVDGLYTDFSLSESEFQTLRKAWKGTPTSTFAKKVLKAFDKKKPHKILKALQKALVQTAEHHKVIKQHLTTHARRGVVEHAVKQKSKETGRLLTEKQVRFTDGGTKFIAVDHKAYQELMLYGEFRQDPNIVTGKALKKRIPTIHPKYITNDVDIGEEVVVPTAPGQAIVAGVKFNNLTPVWVKEATPIETLEILIESIGNPKNAPISKSYKVGKEDPEAMITYTIPPQAPVGIIPNVVMSSATAEHTPLTQEFKKQPVNIFTHTTGEVEWADGVKVYQLTDARLTSASVFEYPTTDDGKRKLQEAPTKLKETANQRLQHLNKWARATEGQTAFISYKEFTEEPFTDIVKDFDIVAHFDKIVGLNFDGLKFLVVFGYPKVKHEVVMTQARRQYAGDTQPLPNGQYDELTEEITTTERGITSTERRYKDPRLDKIRRQLATDKIIQAIGRGRHVVWTDTETVIFTSTPIPGITERATLFSTAEFKLATSSSDIDNAKAIIEKGDDKEMQKRGIPERTAQRHAQPAKQKRKAERDAEIVRLHSEGLSQREIEKTLKGTPYQASRPTIKTVIDKWQVSANSNYNILIGNGENLPPHTNVDDTSVLADFDPIEPAIPDSTENEPDAEFTAEIRRKETAYARIDEAVKANDWARIDAEVVKAVSDGVLDVWYDVDSLLSAVSDTLTETEYDSYRDEMGRFDFGKFIIDRIHITHEQSHKPASVEMKILECFADNKMHTPKDIAFQAGITQTTTEEIINEWYENVLVSPGVGETYWMSKELHEKCKAFILSR